MTIPSRKVMKADLLELLKARESLSPQQTYSTLARKWRLTARDKAKRRSGDFLYQHEIRFARQDLVSEGIVSRPSQSGRGTWTLKAGMYRRPEQYADEVPGAASHVEGATSRVVVNRFERSREGRAACLEAQGFSCKVCGMNFETAYGPVGKEAIHVHHLVPISSIRKQYRLNPKKDLVPICPNCHYIIHRREPPFTLGEVRRMLKANRRIHADARKSSARG